MDTSETYIKMCKKAEEIQTPWRREVGDYVWDGRATLILRNIEGDCLLSSLARSGLTIFLCPQDIPSLVWLPRQDQLQEMVEHTCPLDLFNQFFQWCSLTDIGPFDESFEQLWLAFVMHEKYDKIWNNEKWENKVDGRN